jgi:hypothetical protein
MTEENPIGARHSREGGNPESSFCLLFLHGLVFLDIQNKEFCPSKDRGSNDYFMNRKNTLSLGTLNILDHFRHLFV